MQTFISHAIEFVLPDQLRQLAHMSAFSRDIVIRAIRAVPHINESIPVRESLCIRALKYSSITTLMYADERTSRDFRIILCNQFDVVLEFVCRYDDLDFAKFIVAKANSIGIVSLPILSILYESCPRFHDIPLTRPNNQTKSWSIFAYFREQYYNQLKRHSPNMYTINAFVIYLLDTAISIGCIPLVHVLAREFDIKHILTPQDPHYILHARTPITDDMANVLRANGLCKYYKHKLDSYDHIITNHDDELFALQTPFNAFVQGHYVDIDYQDRNTIMQILSIAIDRNDLVMAHQILIQYNLEFMTNDLINTIVLSRGVSIFTVMYEAARETDLPSRKMKILMNMIDLFMWSGYPMHSLLALAKHYSPIFHPPQTSIIDLHGSTDIISVLQLCEHLGIRMCMYDCYYVSTLYLVDREHIIKNIVFLNSRASNPVVVTRPSFSQNDIDCIMDYHHVVRHISPEFINCLSSMRKRSNKRNPRVTFKLSALVGDFAMMRNSGYTLKPTLFANRQLFRFMTTQEYARIYEPPTYDLINSRVGFAQYPKQVLNVSSLRTLASFIQTMPTYDLMCMIKYIRKHCIHLCKKHPQDKMKMVFVDMLATIKLRSLYTIT